ncbi:MAG: hypothetical protein LBU94_01235 [Clostridiales bacterium]|jgi:hypothetical protein|nr:hypothetical protein [Clostridiales bacterium]
MTIQHARNLPTLTEATDGWPIKWQLYRELTDGYSGGAIGQAKSMKESGASTTEAPLHEISHNFDNEKWNYDADALAILKMYYHYSVTNQSMAVSNQSRIFTGLSTKIILRIMSAEKKAM